MPGIFKKLSANDIKITPFEAHKQYDNNNLASIGATTESLAWSGKNKSTFSTGSRLYYQLDKLYYRNYIRERAHRLELDDATYTTQERRLYQSASVLSLSQKTFGSEVQPSSLEFSGSFLNFQYNVRDDGFGNLFDLNTVGAGLQHTDNFPNEDYRVIYLGPTQAFKRADLTLDYETGYEYVNNPFLDGYTRTVYDDSYFLNEVEFQNVNFVTSSNLGFYSIKTPKKRFAYTTELSTVDLQALSSSEQLTVSLGAGTTETGTSGGVSKLFDGNTTSTIAQNVLNIEDDAGSNIESFTLNFNPALTTNQIKTTIYVYQLDTGDSVEIYINNDLSTKQVSNQTLWYQSQSHEATFSDFETLESITFNLSHSAFSNSDYIIQEVLLEATTEGVTLNKPTVVKLPHQPQFNFETNDDFTINFYYDLNTIDHTNSKVSNDYYILTKEGTKSVPILPSETAQHTPLSKTGSAKIGTAPVGNQFPYRIYYKGNHPSANTASLFFERSDGERTQFVSASFFESGSTDIQKFISCKNDNGVLKLKIDAGTETSSSGQNSPTLSKTVSNKANITLYNKPNPNGSYSNFIGYEGGQISQLMMWNQTLSSAEIINISESVVGTPNIGNIFYDNGFIVLTHPKYMNVFNKSKGKINTLKYKNTHLITENEYQCTMTEDEFEFTTNNSIRKIPFSDSEDIADFATGSNFKPYVTSVGLYDDEGNLLVFGKLGQPIKASSETDTTFVIRFDT